MYEWGFTFFEMRAYGKSLFLLSYQFLNIEYIVAAVVCLWVVCILFSGLTTCLNSDRLTLYLRSGY
jgi:hypothetical protein